MYSLTKFVLNVIRVYRKFNMFIIYKVQRYTISSNYVKKMHKQTANTIVNSTIGN